MATEHVTRFYSLALGKYNNFVSTATDGLIALGDTTPDVGQLSLLYHDSNAGTLAITDFDSGGEGQLVMVQNRNLGIVTFTESCVTINSAALGQNQNITFRKNLTKWYEIARGGNEGVPDLAASAILADSNATLTFGTGGSAANIYLSNNTRVLVLCRTTRMVYKSFSGGYEGQNIMIVKINSSHNELAIGTGNLVCGNTSNNIVITTSDVVLAWKYNGQWHCFLPGAL